MTPPSVFDFSQRTDAFFLRLHFNSVELGIVIGKKGTDIPAETAMDHIAGISTFDPRSPFIWLYSWLTSIILYTKDMHLPLISQLATSKMRQKTR